MYTVLVSRGLRMFAFWSRLVKSLQTWSPNVVLMLGQRRKWWPNIKTTLVKCIAYYCHRPSPLAKHSGPVTLLPGHPHIHPLYQSPWWLSINPDLIPRPVCMHDMSRCPWTGDGSTGQRQTAIAEHWKSKQLLLFVFVRKIHTMKNETVVTIYLKNEKLLLLVSRFLCNRDTVHFIYGDCFWNKITFIFLGLLFFSVSLHWLYC